MAALMIGGGIGVTAYAGDTSVTGRGPTEREALADADRKCKSQGLITEIPEVPPRPSPSGVNPEGQLITDFTVTVRCIDEQDGPFTYLAVTEDGATSGAEAVCRRRGKTMEVISPVTRDSGGFQITYRCV
jgi:hypothetical protein